MAKQTTAVRCPGLHYPDYYGNNLTAFLRQYVNFRRDAYNADGTLTEVAAKAGIKVLLDGGVFDSPEDMRQEAFKNYGIFLAPALFEKEEKK